MTPDQANAFDIIWNVAIIALIVGYIVFASTRALKKKNGKTYRLYKKVKKRSKKSTTEYSSPDIDNSGENQIDMTFEEDYYPNDYNTNNKSDDFIYGKFNVVLCEIGHEKIQVIKIVRENTGWDLTKAVEVVENIPATILENVEGYKALELKKQLECTGAIAELKNVVEQENFEEDYTLDNISNVVLTDVGDNKIRVIKIVMQNTGWSLSDSKRAVENTPVSILSNVKKRTAKALKKQLDDVGATVEVI